MLSSPNLLMIGANARNAGKTTLACRIIERFSPFTPIVGLKVTRLKTGEEFFHGSHETAGIEGWTITEELAAEGSKDTSRLMRAGASRCYYIQADETMMEIAFQHFIREHVPAGLIVCESRSLRNWVKPAVFILMLRDADNSVSKDVTRYMGMADLICRQGHQAAEIERIVSKLDVIGDTWSIKQ